MSILTILVTVDCDICGTQLTVEPVRTANLDSQVDDILSQQGWWSRADFSDICPDHPKPVGAA